MPAAILPFVALDPSRNCRGYLPAHGRFGSGNPCSGLDPRIAWRAARGGSVVALPVAALVCPSRLLFGDVPGQGRDRINALLCPVAGWPVCRLSQWPSLALQGVRAYGGGGAAGGCIPADPSQVRVASGRP